MTHPSAPTPRLTVFLGSDSASLLAAARASGIRLLEWPEFIEGIPAPASEHALAADAAIELADEEPLGVVTHSDVFVLRLRRRVAEKTLAHNAVCIVWTGSMDGRPVRTIHLNDRGTPDWWPAGFGSEPHDEFHALRRALVQRDAVRSFRAPTVFTCRCCGDSTPGWSDGTFDEPGWKRIEHIDGPDAICPKCAAEPTSLNHLREAYPDAKVAKEHNCDEDRH